MIKLMLESSRVEVSRKDGRGMAPLLPAVRTDQTDVARLFLPSRKVNVIPSDHQGCTALCYGSMASILYVKALIGRQ